MGAYPDSDICRHIEVSGKRIWLVLMDRRTPVNRDAAQNEAEKDRRIQPVTPAPGDDASWPRPRPAVPVACSWRSLLHGEFWNSSFPGALLRVAGGCGHELKDHVRGQRSV